MRVLLVGTGVQPIPPTGYGGVERTIAELADALRRQGSEVEVLNEVRAGRGTDEFRFARRLGVLLDGRSYDVLHASTPIVANALARLGRSYVYTTHSRHWFEARGLRGRWGRWVEKRAVRRARHTVALTVPLQRRILELVGERFRPSTTVIPIGVDADRFRPDWERRSGTVALGVGVVRPFKRWELAATALRGTGFRLRIAGPTPDPAYASRLRSIALDLELLGEVREDDLERLYRESDLLVHPSRVELLAGVVLQALAAGLPVLGAEPVADLVPAGAGACAPAGSDEAAIVRFLAEQANRLRADPALLRAEGEAARREAVARYDWSAIARQHLDLYARLLASGPFTR